MKISVAIAAHPKREQLVEELLDRLDTQPVIVWDTEDDIWDTHKRAWESGLGSTSNYYLVIQDDALPCLNLIQGMEQALPHVPIGPVSLYFGNARNHPKVARAALNADTQQASWIISSGFWWGVAAMLPVGMISEMLAFCSPRRETYDRRLSIWTEHNQLPVYYPWPSMVDHIDEPSLAHVGRRPGRKAYKFVGEYYSALAFDGSRGIVQCGKVGPIPRNRKGSMK